MSCHGPPELMRMISIVYGIGHPYLKPNQSHEIVVFTVMKLRQDNTDKLMLTSLLYMPSAVGTDTCSEIAVDCLSLISATTIAYCRILTIYLVLFQSA